MTQANCGAPFSSCVSLTVSLILAGKQLLFFLFLLLQSFQVVVPQVVLGTHCTENSVTSLNLLSASGICLFFKSSHPLSPPVVGFKI